MFFNQKMAELGKLEFLGKEKLDDFVNSVWVYFDKIAYIISVINISRNVVTILVLKIELIGGIMSELKVIERNKQNFSELVV